MRPFFWLAVICGALSWQSPVTASPTKNPHASMPPVNPYLAREFNNQSHWNDAATDSTDIAVPRGHYAVTVGSYMWILSEALSIPHYSAIVAGRPELRLRRT